MTDAEHDAGTQTQIVLHIIRAVGKLRTEPGSVQHPYGEMVTQPQVDPAADLYGQ